MWFGLSMTACFPLSFRADGMGNLSGRVPKPSSPQLTKNLARKVMPGNTFLVAKTARERSERYIKTREEFAESRASLPDYSRLVGEKTGERVVYINLLGG